MSRAACVAFALLYILCCSASCLAFAFEDCGATLGQFTEVSVSGCNTSDAKCTLVRGTNASISIKFKPNQDIPQFNVSVHGIMASIPIPFPLNKPDACKDPDDGIVCPLQKDQEYHYTTSLYVMKIYPSVSVNIKWEFVNENNEKIVCIEFPAKVK